MAKPPAGPLANTPRDLRDDFVGVPADPATGGKPMRWPPNRKKMVNPKDTFHSKVTGDTSMPRADRASHFRKGGFVRAGKK
jgi:hypothetical protein